VLLLLLVYFGSKPGVFTMREWNTPVRAPWNVLIHQMLMAIDRHGELYRQTGNGWHAAKAGELRQYVADLKTWIHHEEDR